MDPLVEDEMFKESTEDNFPRIIHFQGETYEQLKPHGALHKLSARDLHNLHVKEEQCKK